MGWDKEGPKEVEQKEVEQVEAVKEEAQAEPETPEVVEEVKYESSTDTEVKTEEPKKDEPMVPQAVLGKVVKKIREKGRNESAQYQTRIQQLEEENRKLKETDTWETEEESPEINETLIEQKVRDEFLKRQDAYGREKHGDNYQNAIDLIGSINDPVLVNKIQNSANPADMLMEEAMRIAQDMELGSTPQEREQKKRELIEAEVRKKVEAEMAEKLKARSNQPTSVQGLRQAGGDVETPKPRSGWGDVLPKS